MSVGNPPSRPEPAFRATITGSVLDDETRGQVVVTTVPVFSQHLAARSELPGETEYADHVDFQRVAVTCTGQADFGRADATRLAAALILAVIDTMDRGRLRHDDAIRLIREINDLHSALNRLHAQAVTSAQRAAPTTDDPLVS